MKPQNWYPDKAPRADKLLDILSHHLRREIIYFFENVADSRTVSFETLVSHIEGRVPRISKEELEVALSHTHLPKLDDTGWLDYDYRTGKIRYYGHDNAESWLQEVQVVFATDGQ